MLPSIPARSYEFGKLSSLDDDEDYSTGHGYYGNNSMLWNSTKDESSSEEATDDDDDNDGDDGDDDGDDGDEVGDDHDIDRSKNSDKSGDQEKPAIDDIEKNFQELTTN